MASVRLEPQSRIRDYFRAQKAHALAHIETADAGEIAERWYGLGSGAAIIARGLHTRDRNEFLRGSDNLSSVQQKAGVSGQGLAGSEFEGTDARSIEVFDAVLEGAIVGRIPSLRRVPFNVKLLGVGTDPVAAFVAEGAAIPMTRAQLTGASLPTRKVAALTAMSKELIAATGNLAETIFERQLRQAIAYRTDVAFIDPTVAGSASTPAAVTYGAPTSASTGDIRTDLAELVEHFAGDIAASVLVMHPQTAVQLALVTDSSGTLVFNDIGPGGGSLVQIPVLTSRAVPWDTSGGTLALIDGSGIAYAAEGGRILATDEALIELDDSPSGDATTPTAGSATLVSMFQTENVAMRVSARVNWERQRAGCVSVISGASYS